MSVAASNAPRASGTRAVDGARRPSARPAVASVHSPTSPPSPLRRIRTSPSRTSTSRSTPASASIASSGSRALPSVAERLHRPALDEQLAVAEPELPVRPPRREQVVGDHHDRHAELLVHALERIEHQRRRLAVELGRRLVGEQDLRQVRERDGDRDALLLAARELPGPVVRAVGEPDHLEQLARRPAGGGDLHPARGRGEPHVLHARSGRAPGCAPSPARRTRPGRAGTR